MRDRSYSRERRDRRDRSGRTKVYVFVNKNITGAEAESAEDNKRMKDMREPRGLRRSWRGQG